MRAASDLIALVGLEAVQRIFVFFRPDGDRLQAEFVGGAENADGDLGTVGDEDFGDRHEAGSPSGHHWAGVMGWNNG